MKTPPVTALVTGAGTGLGAQLAQRLAASGVAVAVHYRSSKSGAEKVVTAIRKSGGTAHAFTGQIDSQRGARTLVQQVTKWSGGTLDILINNAGAYGGARVAKLSEKDWQAGLQSTASAALFTTQAALPFLRRSKCNGGARIVNLGDGHCEDLHARDVALGYHVGKVGVVLITRSIAKAEARYGITCNLVSPGFLETSVGLPSKKEIPAGRFGTADDIWNAVEFLLRPESNYLTGTNLQVSGGWGVYSGFA